MAKAAPMIALLAGALALLGVLGAQLGLFAPMTAFMLFAAGALLGGLLSLLTGLIGAILSRGGRNPDGMKLSLAGMAAGVGLLSIVAIAGSPGSGLPPINDISTDLESPPQFADPQIVPSYVGRNMSYPADFIPQVKSAYADLAPLTLDGPPQPIYETALVVAEEMGWEIMAQSGERFVFDAEDETSLFRFVDDITVRVRGEGGRSKVDVRSKSRDGKSDLGANAARIRDFLAQLEAKVAA